MIDDDAIYIDATTTAAEIDAMGLTARQLTMCYEEGYLGHLSADELKDLSAKAAERFAAELAKLNVPRD